MSIVEVARAAGVSTATVSRVLNDFQGVRAETVAQVRAALDQMKYDRNQRRRRRNDTPRRSALKTGNIAAITLGQSRTWLQLPIMATALSGIQRATGEHGLRLILQELPDFLSGNRIPWRNEIDGAVVFLDGKISPVDYEAALSNLSAQMPIVWAMGQAVTVAGVDHVAPDNVGAGHLAYSRLAQQGCEEVAFLTTDPAWPLIRQRGQAFLNRAADDGKMPVAYLVTENKYVAQAFGHNVVTAPTLEALVAAMARHTPRPTGLFVANDWTTAAIYPHLARHGFQPQRDLFIVSCDNEDIRLSTLNPRPPSIDLRAEEIGCRSVIRLLGRIQTPDDPTLIIQVAAKLCEPPAV